MLFIAIVLGITFWFVISRTRFGFEHRPVQIYCRRVSGVDSKRMTFVALALSGAVAV